MRNDTILFSHRHRCYYDRRRRFNPNRGAKERQQERLSNGGGKQRSPGIYNGANAIELELVKRRHIAVAMCLLLFFIGGCTSSPPDTSPTAVPSPSPTLIPSTTPTTSEPSQSEQPSPVSEPSPSISFTFGDDVLEDGPEYLIPIALYSDFIGTGVVYFEIGNEDGIMSMRHHRDLDDAEDAVWEHEIKGSTTFFYLFGDFRQSGQYIVTATLGYYDENRDMQPVYRSNPLMIDLTVVPPVLVDSVTDSGLPSWRNDIHLFVFTGAFNDYYTPYYVHPYDSDGNKVLDPLTGGHGNVTSAFQGRIDFTLIPFGAVYATIQEVGNLTIDGDKASATITLPQDPMIELVWLE